MAKEPVEWNTEELKDLAKSMGSDKDGRKLKKEMEAQFDSITETLRDRLREEVADLPGLGSYPSVLAESVKFKTKLIGGRKARVSVVGEGRTEKGKWREVGKLLDDGYLYHPAWGHWRGMPNYLRQDVPEAPWMVEDVLEKTTPVMADEIRAVLTEYAEKLVAVRKANKKSIFKR